MPSTRGGSIRLFQFAGVDVFLHWSWFLVAVYEIQSRPGKYSSIGWNVAEYLALFLIVTLHEFGHAMACRQVGGTANRIVLWPLGGVAYVDPPARPGATLWSIAAGPLVNVALLPVLGGLYFFGRSAGWAETMPDLYKLADAVLWMDGVLLVFNMLPIYPLDGGQILRVAAVVCDGAGAQPDGCHGAGLCRGSGIYWSGAVGAIMVVWRAGRVHADELLGRTAACAGALATGEIAAQGRVCLSKLPHRAARRELLEMRTLRAAVRHVRDAGGLSAMRNAVRRDEVPGLREIAPHERVDDGAADAVACVGDAKVETRKVVLDKEWRRI